MKDVSELFDARSKKYNDIYSEVNSKKIASPGEKGSS